MQHHMHSQRERLLGTELSTEQLVTVASFLVAGNGLVNYKMEIKPSLMNVLFNKPLLCISPPESKGHDQN